MLIQDVAMPTGQIPEKHNKHKWQLGGMDSPAESKRPWQSRDMEKTGRRMGILGPITGVLLVVVVVVSGSTEETNA